MRYLLSIVIAVAGSACSTFAATVEHPFALATKTELGAARQKAQRCDWARKSLQQIVAEAEAATKRPLDIPDRGGQWTHWYACKKDGAHLTTASPTEHKCSRCGQVYRGEPYDSVPLTFVHGRNSADLQTLGLAYGLTGEKKYADQAIKILMGYSSKYPRYALHDRHGVVAPPAIARSLFDGARVGAQTLDEACWLIPVVQGFDLVWDRMTPSQRDEVAANVLRPSAETIRIHLLGIHNIQCWKNSALGLVGLVLGDEKLTAEAIDDSVRGFRHQIEGGVTKDGLWYEGSMGYHIYTMSALWPLAVAARNANIDLFSDRYRLLYEVPIRLALPDGSSPGFNDSAGGNVRGLTDMYELAFSRWKTPIFGRLITTGSRVRWQSLLWGIERLPTGNVLPTTSDNLPVAGYGMLRTAPEPGRVDTVAIRYGMHGGGHGHPDKLNIVIYGGGELLAVDPGSISYGVPLHREWYRSTIAHNTVCVDQALQKPVDGSLEDFEAGELVTRMAAKVADAYAGVSMRRSLNFRASPADRRSVLIDRFEVTSDKPHTYDWAFHCRGEMEVDADLSTKGDRPGTSNGYQHISSVRQGKCDGNITVRWTQGKARLRLVMKGAPGTMLFAGQAPGRDPSEKVPMIIVRRKATETAFEATMNIEQR